MDACAHLIGLLHYRLNRAYFLLCIDLSSLTRIHTREQTSHNLFERHI